MNTLKEKDHALQEQLFLLCFKPAIFMISILTSFLCHFQKIVINCLHVLMF